MNSPNKFDRPFLEKFNNSTFFKNENELHNSISAEIANVLSTNIRIRGNIFDLPTTDYNPYTYGTRDLQSLLCATEVRNEFIEHCRKQILVLEPRIKSCEILNVYLDYSRQLVKFDLTYTINDCNDLFTTTVTLRT